jgi:hypothetical protein
MPSFYTFERRFLIECGVAKAEEVHKFPRTTVPGRFTSSFYTPLRIFIQQRYKLVASTGDRGFSKGF